MNQISALNNRKRIDVPLNKNAKPNNSISTLTADINWTEICMTVLKILKESAEDEDKSTRREEEKELQ